MGGGLMQLVAYGAQDIYLTGNPQITFFKVVYRRHTNFSMESIAQTWNGTSSGSNGRCTATISRNGDLIYRMYLQLDPGGTFKDSVCNPSAEFIKDVELEIGGQKIDKHSGDWMETWAELTEQNPTGTVTHGSNMTTSTVFQRMSGMGGVCADSSGASPNVQQSVQTGSLFMVPLQFWFCRNPGLALPLIALQYHEVKVILNQQAVNVYTSGSVTNELWVDYIYLDTDERRRFAQVSHEYLIEQVQEQSWSNTTKDINFNHPVKELIWRKKEVNNQTAGDDNSNSMAASGDWQLKLNGHDRFAARDIKYFTRTQVWEHHSGSGGLDSMTQGSSTSTDGKTGAGLFNDSIAVYSFALKPEEHQPSGTCNFSRIDNAQLSTTASSGSEVADTVYAVNYNVLRIMSGMGGLAYSN
jgi:hypothetical protein